MNVMLFYLLQAGLDSADAAAQAAAAAAVIPHEEEMSLLSMALKGGWLMLVLLILSILAFYIFGKKWWMIHKAGDIDANFMRDIRDYIHEGKLMSALSLCEKYDSLSQDWSRRAFPGSEGRCPTYRRQSRTPATPRWPGLRRDFQFSPR